MASRKRRRGSGGHPAKVAQRRERERARHSGRSREAVLRRTVAGLCQDALLCETALVAELWASELLGSWWPARVELEAADQDLEVGGPLVEEMARRADAGALAALVAIGEVSDGELGLRARGHAERLRGDGVPPPQWGEAILEAQILRTAVMREDVFDDGLTVFIEARHDGGERHAIGVYIDNNLGVMAKDILLAESIELVENVMRQSNADDGVLRFEAIDPVEAGARIHAAMKLTEVTFDPPVGEDYARLRALALVRADELPGSEVDLDLPEVSAKERDRLFEEFLAAPEGKGMEPGSDHADVISLAIDFCCDYVDGRPLRWSPVVVELFMADWLPRKVVADHALFEAVPAALQAWVRYTGRMRGNPEWATTRTAGSIAEWVDEMLSNADDPAAAGPAKRFIAAAKEAGVDLADDEAMASFIAGWNARSNAA